MCLYSISFSFLQPVLSFLLSLQIYVFIYFYFHILRYFLQTALQSDSVSFDVFWAAFSRKTMTYKIPAFLPVWIFDLKTKQSAFCCCTSQQWDLCCSLPVSPFMPQEVPQLLQGVVDPGRVSDGGQSSLEVKIPPLVPPEKSLAFAHSMTVKDGRHRGHLAS